MEKVIRVMELEVGKTPLVTQVSNELSYFQGFVGGYIEAVRISTNVYMICNEEGKLMGLPSNVSLPDDIVVGNVVFVGCNNDGDFASLPMDEIDPLYEFVWASVMGVREGD